MGPDITNTSLKDQTGPSDTEISSCLEMLSTFPSTDAENITGIKDK